MSPAEHRSKRVAAAHVVRSTCLPAGPHRRVGDPGDQADARTAGISETAFGTPVAALADSLPELATAVLAVRPGDIGRGSASNFGLYVMSAAVLVA